MFYILLIMLFIHVIDDFHLQGILANMKQINWWKKEIYKGQRDKFNMYRNDWIPCIIWHAFQWSCMIIIPCIVNNFNITNKLYFYMVIFINMIAMRQIQIFSIIRVWLILRERKPLENC